jgi:hypothetical protein
MTHSRCRGCIATAGIVALMLVPGLSAQDLFGRWFSTSPGLSNSTATTARDVPALDADDDPETGESDIDDWNFGDLRSLPRDDAGGCDPDAPDGQMFRLGGAATPGTNGSQLVGTSGR